MRIEYCRALILHWAKMVVGRSYWHAAQGLGPSFRPGELGDYYRDYTKKVEWEGALEQSNLPLMKEPGGVPFIHPLMLAQKALGHWSSWLKGGPKREEHSRAFIHLARWLASAQESQGSWKLPELCNPLFIVPYSALTQGQTISVLVRAFSLTSDEMYLEAARRGLQFMLKPVEKGGTSRITSEGLILEEFLTHKPNTILNGWVSALYGLYDVLLVVEDREASDALEDSVKALLTYLPKYNAKYWSFYDTSGSLASPYYHRVHITQLTALELTFPRHSSIFKTMRTQFEKQLSSNVCCTKAFILKGFQKLRNPPRFLAMQAKKV